MRMNFNTFDAYFCKILNWKSSEIVKINLNWTWRNTGRKGRITENFIIKMLVKIPKSLETTVLFAKLKIISFFFTLF